jgi:division protein 1
MGGIFDTIQFDHAVTGLQFDTRKIIAATGENGVKVGLAFNNRARVP